MQKLNNWQKDMVKQQGKLLSSIVLLGVFPSPKSGVRKLPGPLSNIYTRLDELPLHVFIDCVLSRDLSLLYKSDKGQITQELTDIWEAMYQEYAVVVGGTSFSHIQDLVYKINATRLNIDAINSALYQLGLAPAERLIAALRNIGFAFDVNNYQVSIERIRSQAKGLVVKLQMSEKELEALTSDKTNKAPTREYFDGLIVTVEKYMGFPISEDIMTSKFIRYIARIQQENKQKASNG